MKFLGFEGSGGLPHRGTLCQLLIPFKVGPTNASRSNRFEGHPTNLRKESALSTRARLVENASALANLERFLKLLGDTLSHLGRVCGRVRVEQVG